MLKLIPFTEEHFETLLSWIPSKEFLIQWSGPFFEWPLTTNQLLYYLNRSRETNSSTHIYTAILEGYNNVPVGHIEISNINRYEQSAMLSRVLVSPEYRGRGLGDTLVKSALDIAFTSLNLFQVNLFVFTFNTAAIHCYEKLGFQTCYVYPRRCWIGNKFYDAKFMSLTSLSYHTRYGKFAPRTKKHIDDYPDEDPERLRIIRARRHPGML